VFCSAFSGQRKKASPAGLEKKEIGEGGKVRKGGNIFLRKKGGCKRKVPMGCLKDLGAQKESNSKNMMEKRREFVLQ